MESMSEILRSKEEKRILTGNIAGIEDEYYNLQNLVTAIAFALFVALVVTIRKIDKKKNTSLLGR